MDLETRRNELEWHRSQPEALAAVRAAMRENAETLLDVLREWPSNTEERHLAKHRLLSIRPDNVTADAIMRRLVAQEEMHRAQFAPTVTPSLWERLKRWWYSR